MIHPTNFHLHGERSTCHQKVAAAQRRKVKLNIYPVYILPFLIFDHEFVIPESKENNNSEEKIKKKKKKKKQRQVAYYNI